MGACLSAIASQAVNSENERLRALVAQLQEKSSPGLGVPRTDSNNRDATAVCDAAAAGDVEWLRRAADAGADLAAGDYDKRTAMHLAASEGRIETLLFLIVEAGVEVSPVDRWGGTPLDDAIRTRHEEAVSFLLSHGGRKGLTAMDHAQSDLCDAASKGDLSLLRELVERGRRRRLRRHPRDGRRPPRRAGRAQGPPRRSDVGAFGDGGRAPGERERGAAPTRAGCRFVGATTHFVAPRV